MKRLIIFGGLTAALLAVPLSHLMIGEALANIGGDGTNGECAVDDADFASAGGGCKDITTGLVWSSTYFPSSDAGGSGRRLAICSEWFVDQPEAGGHTDWRNPTVGEIDEAIDNGLNAHLDFLYDQGFQSVDDLYRLTACAGKKNRGNPTVYKYRYSDGDTLALFESDVPVICVRGLPETPDSCPGKKKGGGKPKR